ncbi:MAG: HNH endonuclease [Elusimicrobiota bacterium]
MNLYVGITDRNWFEFLANRPDIDEVNFWQPSGNRQFRALQKGELFLFKLHAPDDVIVGYGIFAHSSILPISQAWDYFREKNGVNDLIEMRARVEKYRRIPPQPFEDYPIGCIMLQQPTFLHKSKWFRIPGWKKGIQQGATFDLESEIGKLIFKNIHKTEGIREMPIQQERFGEPVQVLPRLGQATFRSMVLDNYNRKCAVTAEKILPILISAHIKPYKLAGHQPSNGILLRTDIHTLFDRGYMTISPDYHVEVSKRIKTDFDNGKNYYALHGNEILLPSSVVDQPDKVLLQWHNENIFKAG